MGGNTRMESERNIQYWPDIMVDIETTGIRPDRSAILQLAAVKFNLQTLEVCVDDMFVRTNISIPNSRMWDHKTFVWMGKNNPQVIKDILNKPTLDFKDTFLEFREFCGIGKPTFWAKNAHFDFMMIESYYNDLEICGPFQYWNVNDMSCFIRSYYFPEPVPKIDLGDRGQAHEALDDVIFQIKTLFEHTKRRKGYELGIDSK